MLHPLNADFTSSSPLKYILQSVPNTASAYIWARNDRDCAHWVETHVLRIDAVALMGEEKCKKLQSTNFLNRSGWIRRFQVCLRFLAWPLRDISLRGLVWQSCVVLASHKNVKNFFSLYVILCHVKLQLDLVKMKCPQLTIWNLQTLSHVGGKFSGTVQISLWIRCWVKLFFTVHRFPCILLSNRKSANHCVWSLCLSRDVTLVLSCESCWWSPKLVLTWDHWKLSVLNKMRDNRKLSTSLARNVKHVATPERVYSLADSGAIWVLFLHWKLVCRVQFWLLRSPVLDWYLLGHNKFMLWKMHMLDLFFLEASVLLHQKAIDDFTTSKPTVLEYV